MTERKDSSFNDISSRTFHLSEVQKQGEELSYQVIRLAAELARLRRVVKTSPDNHRLEIQAAIKNIEKAEHILLITQEQVEIALSKAYDAG